MLLQNNCLYYYRDESRLVELGVMPLPLGVQVLRVSTRAAPEWEDDTPECFRCLVEFTLINRRHHCRRCGKTVCASCSPHWIELPQFGYYSPVRVCVRCYPEVLDEFKVKGFCTASQRSTARGRAMSGVGPAAGGGVGGEAGAHGGQSEDSSAPCWPLMSSRSSEAGDGAGVAAAAVARVAAGDGGGGGGGGGGGDGQEDVENALFSLPRNGRPFMFAVRTSERELWLSAKTEEERQQWIDAFKRMKRQQEEVQRLVKLSQSEPPDESKVEEWTTADVLAWLASVRLEQYCPQFERHAVDGPMLLVLNLGDLVNVIGVGDSLHRRKLIHLRDRIKAKLEPALEPPTRASAMSVGGEQLSPREQAMSRAGSIFSTPPPRKSMAYTDRPQCIVPGCGQAAAPASMRCTEHAAAGADDGGAEVFDPARSGDLLAPDDLFEKPQIASYAFQVGEEVAYYSEGEDLHRVGVIKRKVFDEGRACHVFDVIVSPEGDTERMAASSLLKFASTKVRWRKGKVIGKGAYGKVYEGLNKVDGTTLAIKEMRLTAVSVDKNHTAMLQKEIGAITPEISLMQMLDHVNIVKFLGTEVKARSNKLFILMERVSGGSIRDMLNKYGPLPEPVVAAYTRQIVRGLIYLHSNGIVHRDLKGSNVLITSDGVVKLADFGVAKKLRDVYNVTKQRRQRTNLKTMVGSPFWMAPEVITQAGYGRRADVWSLGCTVLEMVTAKVPWGEYNQLAAVFAISQSDELPTIPEDITPECRDFILTCIRRDKDARPHAHQLLQHPFLSDSRPTHIQRPSDMVSSPVTPETTQRYQSGATLKIDPNQGDTIAISTVSTLSSLSGGSGPRAEPTAVLEPGVVVEVSEDEITDDDDLGDEEEDDDLDELPGTGTIRYVAEDRAD